MIDSDEFSFFSLSLSQLMIRGHSHLTKYISNPVDARRFVSDNPERDLNEDIPDMNMMSGGDQLGNNMAGLMNLQQQQQPSAGLSSLLRRNSTSAADSALLHQLQLQQRQNNLAALIQLTANGGAAGGGAGPNIANLLAAQQQGGNQQMNSDAVAGGNNMLLDALRNPQRRSSASGAMPSFSADV